MYVQIFIHNKINSKIFLIMFVSYVSETHFIMYFIEIIKKYLTDVCLKL